MKLIIVLSAAIVGCLAQRPTYARRPVGYPDIRPTTLAPSSNGLQNKFGEQDSVSTTTMRLPIEALGDADLVARLKKLPIDQQPFWLINWQALEDNRNKPQTYPIRGNSFMPNPNTIFQ